MCALYGGVKRRRQTACLNRAEVHSIGAFSQVCHNLITSRPSNFAAASIDIVDSLLSSIFRAVNHAHDNPVDNY
jgi:hypothetical protein